MTRARTLGADKSPLENGIKNNNNNNNNKNNFISFFRDIKIYIYMTRPTDGGGGARVGQGVRPLTKSGCLLGPKPK